MPPAAPPPFDSMELVWIWDPDGGRIIWASEAAIAFWGERRLGDLQARPFLTSDPNAEAMNALLASAVGAADDPREATLTFFPDGAPVRLRCAGLARRRGDGPSAKTWLAIHASPPELAAGDAKSTRAQLLLDGAETAFALTDAIGAPLLLNAAARRLYGVDEEEAVGLSLFDRHRAPDRARRAAAAALMRGAFAHTADIEAGAEGRTRALILYRRAIDPDTGETLLSLEATPRPPRGSPSAAEHRLAFQDDGDPRVGAALFDAAGLRLREWNAAFAALLGDEAAARGADLTALFPEKADALVEAADALRHGADAPTLDLPLGEGALRGPWGAGRLSLAPGPGEPRLLLTLLDFGPERRRLLLADQRRAAGETALAGIGVGLVELGPEGALRRADAAVAEALGLVSGALEDLDHEGLKLPDRLAPPSNEQLAARLQALFQADGGAIANDLQAPPIEAALTSSRGQTRPVRLALSAPLAFGKTELVAALDLSDRPLAVHDLSALAAGPAPSQAIPSQRLLRGASHQIRTALTTIKGFAEMARDDDADPLAARQRRRLSDIVQTAEALTAFVDRTFDLQPETAPHPDAARFAGADLAEVAAAAAARTSGRHPVWSASSTGPVPARIGRDDLDEALDILLAEAADRSPIRVNAIRAAEAEATAAIIEFDATGEAPAAWPPLALRAAELLIERAGGVLRLDAPSLSGAGVVGLRIVFPIADADAPQQT